MSLPEKPLTRRETYLAKAAGQDVTLPEEDLTREEQYLRAIAEGGSGGGVTPEYVAEAIAEAKTDIEAEIPTKTSDLTNDSGYAAIDDTTAAQDKAYSSAKVEEKVAGEEITTTATGTDLTLSTSSGNLNALTVYGKSEIVDGNIKSAGEGWSTVDLGTLNWNYSAEYTSFSVRITDMATGTYSIAGNILCAKYQTKSQAVLDTESTGIAVANNANVVIIKDPAYTDATTFKNSLNGVLLCYEEATPTNNTIAVKTDNGSGIDGTMAVFNTGTPLRGIPDSNVRDVMQWDGSAGTVTKVCGKLRLADLTWVYFSLENRFYATLANAQLPADNAQIAHIYCAKYVTRTWEDFTEFVYDDFIAGVQTYVGIRDTNYNTVEGLVASLGDEELIYELATHTTEQMTTAENDSIAGLRTFEPQTHVQNNAGATMTVEAYAGTENGKAVADLKSELKITQSDTLTLTVAAWSNNAQTIAYAHDTAKRNVIDVDPSSVEEWAGCGVLATAETATSITFTCKTVPENALNFRVTSMGV